MTLLERIRAGWMWLVTEVRKARHGHVRQPGDVVVGVKHQDGPVVESRDLKRPLPLTRVPIRSTRKDAKRLAREMAERHSGRSMTWAQAYKYLAALERDQPDLQLTVPRDLAHLV